jgi:hypothetical protein
MENITTKLNLNTSFAPITAYLGQGASAPPNWRRLKDEPLLIFVGLTSVGKTSTFAALEAQGVNFTLLPDRRDMTDHLIINPILAMDGKQPYKMSRVERYPFMLKYRAMYSGGMAHALTRLWFDPDQTAPLLMFNGLRGENETRYAIEALPVARFVALVAPAFVRLQRMLKRDDPHDRIKPESLNNLFSNDLNSFADLGVAQASHIFNAVEEQTLIEMVKSREISAKDLQDKLKIMVIDQQSYDSDGSEILQALAPERTVLIDTTQNAPAQVAKLIIEKFGLLSGGKE